MPVPLMDKYPSEGPPAMFDATRIINAALRGITDDGLEELTYELIKADHANARRLRAPHDGGLDVVASTDVGIVGWQVKNFGARIYWNKCRASVVQALKQHRPKEITFVFPRDLTGKEVIGWESFRAAQLKEFPNLTNLDYWGSTDLIRRLRGRQDLVKRALPELAGILNPELHGVPSYWRRPYLREVQDLLQYYSERFVGREDQMMHAVNRTLDNDSGYTLVEGPSGSGKSAFTAQLLGRLTALPDRIRPVVVAFFVRADSSDDTARAFLSAVNSQFLDELSLQGGVPSDFETLRVQFSNLWFGALDQCEEVRPLVLLVDGLDEMANEEVSIAGCLPRTFVPGAHVIVTSRPSPDPRRVVSTAHPLRRASPLDLPPLRRRDIETLLEAVHGFRGDIPALAARVDSATGGVPLYVRFACEELSPDQLAEPLSREVTTEGVRTFIERQIQRLERTLTDVGWQILGLLLAAPGPMTIDEVSDAIGIPSWATRNALRPLDRFLLYGNGMQVSPPHFRGSFVEHLGVGAIRDAETVLLKWSETYERAGWPATTPIFIMRHLSAISLRGEGASRVGNFLDSKWLLAKASRLPLRLLAEELEGIQRILLEQSPLPLSHVLRGSFIAAMLNSSIQELPRAAFRAIAFLLGTAAAEDYVLASPDAASRAQGLLEIGLASFRNGAGRDGRVFLERALAEAVTAEPWIERQIVSAAVCALATGGDIQTALGVVSALPSDRRAGHQAEIAEALADVGRGADAIAIVDAIDDSASGRAGVEGDARQARIRVIRRLVSNGHLETALSIVANEADGHSLVDLQAAIVESLCGVGRYEEVLGIAQSLRSARQDIGTLPLRTDANVLCLLVRAFSAVGDEGSARACLSDLTALTTGERDPAECPVVHARVAEALAYMGSDQLAVRYAKEAGEAGYGRRQGARDDHGERALMEVAIAFAHSGQPDCAWRVIQEIEHSEPRDEAITALAAEKSAHSIDDASLLIDEVRQTHMREALRGRLAVRAAEAGQDGKASQLLLEFELPKWRLTYGSEVAIALVATRGDGVARQVLGDSLIMAFQEEWSGSIDAVASNLAVSLTKQGSVAAALESIDTIRPVLERARAVAAMAHATAAADTDVVRHLARLALDLASAASSAEERIACLCEALEVARLAGEPEMQVVAEAIRDAVSLLDNDPAGDWQKGRAARAYSHAGLFDEAQALLSSCGRTIGWVLGVMDLSQQLAQHGYHERALDAFLDSGLTDGPDFLARDIVGGMLSLENLEGAIAYAKGLVDPYAKASALIDVAKALVARVPVAEALAMAKEALRIARGLDHVANRLDLKSRLAEVFAEAGASEMESDIVDDVIGDLRKAGDGILWGVSGDEYGEFLVHHGRMAEALALADSLASDNSASYLRSGVSAALVSKGRLADARSVLPAIERGEQRARAGWLVGASLVEQGTVEDGVKQIADSVRSAAVLGAVKFLGLLGDGIAGLVQLDAAMAIGTLAMARDVVGWWPTVLRCQLSQQASFASEEIRSAKSIGAEPSEPER